MPTEMPGLVDVADVFLGGLVGCAIDPEGTVRYWGVEPALSTTAFAPTAREVPDFSPALDVALGDGFACALKTDHTVWCRGAWENRGQPPGTGAPHYGPATRVVFPFEGQP